MVSHRDFIQTWYHSKPEVEHVKSYEEEKYYSGDPLDQIEPVSWVRVIQIIGARLYRDHQAIDRMINERNKNSADFNEQDVGNRLETPNRMVEVIWAADSFWICVKVFEQEKAERNYARKLMQLAQDEGPAQLDRQGHTPLTLSLDMTANGPRRYSLNKIPCRAGKL